MNASLDRGSLLSLRDVHVNLNLTGQTIPILRGIDLDLDAGESLGIVGESGSGKSMTMRTIMRQLPDRFELQGRVAIKGSDPYKMGRKDLQNIRSRTVGMIHQDPRAHINPMWTIGNFLTEGVLATRMLTRNEADSRAKKLLVEVGIEDPELRMGQYPHQLSGGLLQRVMIVSALMPNPQLILADEPTTALDVTVQAEVMSIFADITKRHGVGVVFITHDLDLAASATDNIAVVYAGRIIEQGPSRTLIDRPSHPYTAGLLAARPSLTERRLPFSIPGNSLSAASAETTQGCSFANRCSFVQAGCWSAEPELRMTGRGQKSACFRADEVVANSGALSAE